MAISSQTAAFINDKLQLTVIESSQNAAVIYYFL